MQWLNHASNGGWFIKPISVFSESFGYGFIMFDLPQEAWISFMG